MNNVRQRILAFLSRREIYIQAQSLFALPTAALKRQFWADYAAARAAIATLQPLPGPMPALAPLPSGAAGHVAALEASDAFQENFGGLAYAFAEVPLDRLIPVQTFVNVTPALPPPSQTNYQELLDYCLPLDASVPTDIIQTAGGIRFLSNRYGLGTSHVRRRLVQGKVILSFEHPNLLQVQQFAGYLIVSNGTHRVYELVRAGFTSAPAIVISRAFIDEVEGLDVPGMWSKGFIFTQPRPQHWGVRPPLITDFLSPVAVETDVLLTGSVVDVTIAPPMSFTAQIQS